MIQRLPVSAYLVLALLGASAACSPANDAVDASTGPFRGTPVDPPVPKVGFTLTDQHGQRFDFRAETEGFVTLLFFGYTHCPDICPVHLTNIAAALDKMTPTERLGVKVVFVTADPARDTPQRLQTWLGAIDPTFVGLTGEDEAINDVLRALHMPEINRQPLDEGYDVVHAAYVITYAKNGEGRLRHPFGIRQADWVHDLRLLLGEETST